MHVKISRFRAKAHLVFHWCLYNEMKYLRVSKNKGTRVDTATFKLRVKVCQCFCPIATCDSFGHEV